MVVTSEPRLPVASHDLEVAPLLEDEAVELWRLLLERLGRASDPTRARAIVRRLDRLPMALLWFAPRAALLGEAAALDRLRRHEAGESPLSQVLVDALAAIDESERAILERVAAYETGVPTEALGLEVERLLPLVDAALLQPREGRLVVAWAAREQLRARARREGRWGARSTEHATEVLTRLSPALHGAEPMTDAVGQERAELEAILQRLEVDDPLLALRAASILALLDETPELATRMAAAAARLDPAVLAAHPMIAVARARLARRRGDLATARALLARNDPQAGARRATNEEFEATLEVAHLDRMQSRLEEAQAGYERALAMAQAAGDPGRECIALGELGRMAQSAGRFVAAQDHHARAIALSHRLGLRRREALERSLHARATHRAGGLEEAVVLHRQALALHRALDRKRLVGAELGHLGYCLHELGVEEEAEAHFREAIAALAAIGDVALENIERLLLARLLADEGRYAEARIELAIVAEATRELDMPRLALTHGYVTALVALGEGDEETARRGLAEALAEGLHPEVGFEVLAPATLGWLEARAGRAEEAEIWLTLSTAEAARLEAPALSRAAALYAAAARGEPLPEVEGVSSDLRRARRLVTKEPATLMVARDGRHLVTGEGDRVELGRRAAPRRILVALVEARMARPGEALTKGELIEVGWPGERLGVEAAEKRLRTAIWTLRKVGLDALLTRDDGYLVDPRLSLRWVEP